MNVEGVARVGGMGIFMFLYKKYKGLVYVY